MIVRECKNLTVGFVALGCPKNMVDSERMLAEIIASGFLISSEPRDADIIVINTCGFIAPAKDEAIEAIRAAVLCKNECQVKKVIVTGCLPERIGGELFKQVDGIDAIVGLGWRNEIGTIIRKSISCEKPVVFLGGDNLTINDDRSRLLIGPAHRAYLRISEGCNRRCSFCTIPAIRGSFRSKPIELILAEARELAESGVVELNVIGQDTTSWGRDLQVENGLVSLANELEKIGGVEWVRLLYLYPGGVTDKLIKILAESEKIVHYLDIPIQHINDRILRRMNRPDTKKKIYSLIEKIRIEIPDAVLRTTIIVGFPGETDRQFEELIEFVKWAEFDALGCFKYYREEGTAAAEMADQIGEDIKEERLEQLMLFQQQIAFAKNRSRVGTELRCLVDSVDGKGGGEGRFYGQAPDIDSVCLIEKCTLSAGQFIDAKVVGVKDYDLIVEQI